LGVEGSRLIVLSALLAILLLGAGACSKSSSDDSPSPHDALMSGEQIYTQMCRSCHGAHGEGGTGPSLRDEKKSQTELTAFIDAQMPLGDPDKCKGTCANDVAAYILATFKGPIVCSAPVPASRGLRLLTRREYKNTIADLLGVTIAGTNLPPATTCGQYTFNYDAKGRTLSTVHVAARSTIGRKRSRRADGRSSKTAIVGP
jgi:hypothetical protein